MDENRLPEGFTLTLYDRELNLITYFRINKKKFIITKTEYRENMRFAEDSIFAMAFLTNPQIREVYDEAYDLWDSYWYDNL